MVDKITDYLVTNKTIQEEDKDIYSYGLKQGVIMLLQTFLVLLVGIVWQMWWQTVLFIFSYTPLRLSSGGIHAGRQWLCFICTVLHAVVVLLVIKYIECSNVLIIAAIAVSTLIILFLAPVEDRNKPFDDAERIVFKKRTRIVLAIELAAVVILILFGLSEAAKSISFTHVSLSVMVILGTVKNTINKHKDSKPVLMDGGSKKGRAFSGSVKRVWRNCEPNR